MHKEMIATAASGSASIVGTLSSWWLWLTDQNAAHVVTTLTVALIASQLFWGWRRFFRGEPR
jgi:hypothetical protein